MTAADTLAAELAAITPQEPRAPLLRALRTYYAEPTATAAARRVAADLARYRASSWRAESSETVSPYRPGSKRDLFFRIVRAGGSAPSARTVRRALCECG